MPRECQHVLHVAPTAAACWHGTSFVPHNHSEELRIKASAGLQTSKTIAVKIPYYARISAHDDDLTD